MHRLSMPVSALGVVLMTMLITLLVFQGDATASKGGKGRPKAWPTATATPTSEPSATPTSESSATPTSEPSATPTSEPSSCLADLQLLGGTPWRPGRCAEPGYSNHVIPPAPALHSAETRKIRTVTGSLLNIERYTEPVYYASAGTALRPVQCIRYGCVGGRSAPVVGHEVVAAGSDAQLVVVDLAGRRSYEMHRVATDSDGTVMINADGSVTVGSMSVVDLDGRGNKTAEGQNLNITGAGVSRMFGVIRAHEVRAAAKDPVTAIPHALQVSLPSTYNCAGTYREPATKTDGRATTSDCVTEGARVQVDPVFSCATLTTPMGQAVCHAMQRYGAYVMDNNGSGVIAFYGQHRRSWSTADADYAAAGIRGDYQSLGLPISALRVLARWDGS